MSYNTKTRVAGVGVLSETTKYSFRPESACVFAFLQKQLSFYNCVNIFGCIYTGAVYSQSYKLSKSRLSESSNKGLWKLSESRLSESVLSESRLTFVGEWGFLWRWRRRWSGLWCFLLFWTWRILGVWLRGILAVGGITRPRRSKPHR